MNREDFRSRKRKWDCERDESRSQRMSCPAVCVLGWWSDMLWTNSFRTTRMTINERIFYPELSRVSSSLAVAKWKNAQHHHRIIGLSVCQLLYARQRGGGKTTTLLLSRRRRIPSSSSSGGVGDTPKNGRNGSTFLTDEFRVYSTGVRDWEMLQQRVATHHRTWGKGKAATVATRRRKMGEKSYPNNIAIDPERWQWWWWWCW